MIGAGDVSILVNIRDSTMVDVIARKKNSICGLRLGNFQKKDGAIATGRKSDIELLDKVCCNFVVVCVVECTVCMNLCGCVRV